MNTPRHTFTVLHLFAGIGGGAIGFQRATGRWSDLQGRFCTLAGIDNDPEACEDFAALSGAPAVCADLAAMTPEQLRAAAGDPPPDVVFASPPCTGFSGLLPKARAAEERYQALNRLVLQGLFLVLETWPHKPPKLILIENVPRITTRGAELLAQAEGLLAQYGYRWQRGTHDCGELGGLGQHRTRFLLIARHERQLPTVVYQPPKQRVRSIGEILGALPLPDDPAAGPLHRLPRLQWRTWVRLALIPAGGDWRDLPAGEYAVVGDPSLYKGRPGLMGVASWGEAASAVTGSASPTGSNGVAAVADPRLEHEPRRGSYRIVRWDETAPTVTGSEGIGRSSSYGVADPRLLDRFRNQLRVERWDDPAHTATGAAGPWQGAPSVADLRLGCSPRSGAYRVQRWGEPASTVIGSADVHAGAAAVADSRLPELPASGDRPDPPPVIISEDGTWHRPLTTMELAALQGLPVRMPDGTPLRLAGRSDARWRKAIGNAVPPPAAQAIAEQMLLTLLQAESGQWLVPPGWGEVWVNPAEELALRAAGGPR